MQRRSAKKGTRAAWALAAAASVVLAHAGAAGAAHHEPVIQAVVMEVQPGKLESYRGQVKQLMAVMKRLGSPARVRMWRATVAGQVSGNVMVGVEYPTQDAWAADAVKLQADAEYRRILGGLDGMRRVLSIAMWRDISPSRSSGDPGPILAITSVTVQPGKLGDYRQRIDTARGISDRLGLVGRVRLWHAEMAGPQTGTVAVGVEYPDLPTWSSEQGKLATDAEWQKLLKGLGSIRTLNGRFLYQEMPL